MEHSTSWEDNRFATSQEIPRILYNPNVHYRIHKCSPPVSILSQLNPVHTPQPTYLRSILILSTHLHLGLPSGLFPSDFPTKTLYTPHPSAKHATYIYSVYTSLNSMYLFNTYTCVPHVSVYAKTIFRFVNMKFYIGKKSQSFLPLL
jgi:hypothetical protein